MYKVMRKFVTYMHRYHFGYLCVPILNPNKNTFLTDLKVYSMVWEMDKATMNKIEK